MERLLGVALSSKEAHPVTNETNKTPGQVAFEAYNAAGTNPGLTWDKKPVPTWENLSDDVRAKWEAAAASIVGLFKAELTIPTKPKKPVDAQDEPGAA
jgi:hypothetical protein